MNLNNDIEIQLQFKALEKAEKTLIKCARAFPGHVE